MNLWLRGVLLVAVGVATMLLLTGCHHRHSKVTVIEEQRQGEVHEEEPGEMIVE